MDQQENASAVADYDATDAQLNGTDTSQTQKQRRLSAWMASLWGLRPSLWSEQRFRKIVAFGVPCFSVITLLILNRVGGDVLPAFKFFLDNLPLTLPILTVALSIMLRPDELTNLDGWLNLCNHFALGLVSFAIWAFVAGQGVEKYIVINDHAVLNKEHSLLLVFGSFIWAGFCSVISALASMGPQSQKQKWRLAQLVLVAISLSFMCMPFYLFESKANVAVKEGISFDEKEYVVSIPYRDPSLNQFLGMSTTPITQCSVARGVTAKSPKQAIFKALSAFRASSEATQFLARRGQLAHPLQVEVLENLIVASVSPAQDGRLGQ